MPSNPSSSGPRLPASLSTGGLQLHRASLVVWLVGVALALGAFLALRGRLQERERTEFERRAGEVHASLRSHLERPLEVLESVCALFDASAEVSRAEFARFVRPALSRHPGIRALEWIPLVPAAERAAYERAARSDGLANFEFVEIGPGGRPVRAADRPEHLPIYYMEPPDDRVLGFDLAAEPPRREPVDRAEARGATAASERIRLIEDAPTTHSIAVFCPVFNRTAPGESQRLRGVGAEVFRMHEVVEPALAVAAEQGLHVVVTDPTAPPDIRLLFESVPGLAARAWPASHTAVIDFADRRWSISFWRGPGYDSELGEPPWGVLITGLALSTLLAIGLSAARIVLHLRRQVHAAQKLGQYTLVRKLGEGGMGVVWEARHALLRRPTAIKLLRPERAGAAAITRFEREVQLTSQLTHPNTVAIYDYGRTADGIFYYVMEYLDGLDLDRLVRLDGPQAPERVVHVMKQVASALREAHALGLVHRDIKPANVVLCERGGVQDVAKVVDFGLVRIASSAEATLSAGNIVGTPLYLAPEAISDPDRVDARSDLYACGAVAYFLLTGHPVFEAPSLVEVCSHHLYTAPQPPSARLGRELPGSLDAVVLRCLAKAPEDRFQSAAELGQALATCGSADWTEADALLAWQRVGGCHPQLTATARTLPADSASALAIDLRRRDQAGS